MDKEKAAILSIDSLKIGFASSGKEKEILPPLNASSTHGELISVIGRNGIGKSTLLRTLAGLQKALGGEILIEGNKISDYSRKDLARQISYISTEIVKTANLTVYELVALGRYPHTDWFGRIDHENNLAITDALERCSIREFSDRFISELSDGERQRAMIARVLAQDTKIMIMDEPTAFLDVNGRYEILHLMHDISRTRGKSIIFSTHDFQSAISQSDKIWLMLEDRLIEGAPEDLLVMGVFNKLFNMSAVRFNSGDGTFSFLGDERGSLYIKGNGKRKFWVEKAINRIGFNSSQIITNPYILVPDNEADDFQIISDGNIKVFSTIYELVSSLK